MAGNTTKKLTLVIAGEDRGASKAVEGLGRSVGGLNSQLGGLGSAIGGVLSVGAITAFGTSAVKAFTDTAGKVAQIKRLTGESAENASLLAFAAQQSGVDADKASQAWTILAKNIDNGKVAAQGIATEDENGNLLGFDKILGNIAEKYNGLSTNIERTALTQKLFGKGGAEIGKILAKGSEGVAELSDEMQKLGLEFDQGQLDKLAKYKAAQRDFEAQVTGLKVAVGEDLIPALTKGFELFGKIPAPVQKGALALTGLSAAAVGLAATYGFLAPAIGTARAALVAKIPALTANTAATAALATAEVAAAEAAAVEAAASAQLQAVLSSQTATEAEVTAALAAKTSATAASAAASEGLAASQASAAASGGGLVASLGAVAVGLGVVVGLYKGIKNATDGTFGNMSIEAQKFNDLLGASTEELVKQAGIIDAVGGGQQGFVDAGKNNINVLYAMRDAVKAAGSELPSLDAAISEVEGSQKLAAERTGDYADETDGATDATDALTDSLRAAADAQRANADAAAASKQAFADKIQGALDERDAQAAVAQAHQNTAEARAGEAEAATDAANAQADAAQAIVDANQDVIDAQEGVAEANKGVADAQRDLTEARVQAVKNLDDLAEAERSAARAQRDAVEAQRDAQIEQDRVNRDLTSSDEDKHDASVAVANANEDVATATDDHKESQEELLAAQRAGIEGDKGVVDAKEKLKDANDAVRDAEDKVREAVRKVGEARTAAAQVTKEAQAKIAEASAATKSALDDEAQAFADLKTKQDGVIAGYYALLEAAKALGADPTLISLLQSLLYSPEAAVQSLGPTAPPGAVNAERSLRGGPTRSAPVVNNVFNLTGSTRQQRKAIAANTTQAVDTMFKRAHR